MAFVTLPPSLRNEGTAFFQPHAQRRQQRRHIGDSGLRDFGRNTGPCKSLETPHALQRAGAQPQVYSQMDSANGLIALNQQVVTQASWISYPQRFLI
ncbi:MAG: hypothetical protein WDO56_37510 [Gammaproteobacteria bacterium]